MPKNDAKPSTGTATTHATVTDLGRKARARLDQELGKRHEIVRLEPAELVDPEKFKKTTKGFVRPKKKAPSKASTSRRKRASVDAKSSAVASSKKRPSITNNNISSNPNVDRRVPNVYQLLPEKEDKESQSHVVRVHGIPVHATRSDLIRFFAGLDPEHVLLLPTNGSRIVEWDAEDCDRNSKEVVLERHPNSFRVLVKFASAPIAALAAQRSGEALYLGSHKSGNDGEKLGAHIAVTEVSKVFARYMLRNMASMAVTCQSNNPLYEELMACEAKLHQLVPRILWSAAVRDLKLTVVNDTNGLSCYGPIDDTGSLLIDPSTQNGYSALVDLHNTLVQDYETITTSTPFPSVAWLNSPELLSDPSIRLTDTAAKTLKARIHHLDNYLHMARTLLHRQRVGATPSVFDCIVPKPKVATSEREEET